MSETSVPTAAVQIVRDALAVRGYLTVIDSVEAPRVAAALARAGWLHDPAEVAALRAVADAARDLDDADDPYGEIREGATRMDVLHDRVAALDALPPADGAR